MLNHVINHNHSGRSLALSVPIQSYFRIGVCYGAGFFPAPFLYFQEGES